MPKFLHVSIWALIALRWGRGSILRTPNRQLRYRALVREFRDAQLGSSKGSSRSRTESDRRQPLALEPDPAAFAQRFLDLAREKPADRSSFDAPSRVVSHCPGAEDDQAL